MVKVLSLRGGGIRGYATAILLAEVERRLGTPGEPKPLCQVFDLIVGTSVGAIMAVGLALDIPATKLVEFFEVEGPEIFKKRGFAPLLRMLGKPRYDTKNLIAALDRHYLPEAVLGLCYTKVMVTSTRYRGDESRLWKSWKHTDMKASIAAASSAAALTYFEPVVIDGFGHGDGGMWANNPADNAVIEAKKLWPASAVTVVDIACPSNKSEFEPRRGIVEAASHVADIFIGAGEDAGSYRARWIIGGDGKFLTFEPQLLEANHDLGDTSKRNMAQLRLCAEYRLERNADEICAAIG